MPHPTRDGSPRRDLHAGLHLRGGAFFGRSFDRPLCRASGCEMRRCCQTVGATVAGSAVSGSDRPIRSQFRPMSRVRPGEGSVDRPISCSPRRHIRRSCLACLCALRRDSAWPQVLGSFLPTWRRRRPSARARPVSPPRQVAAHVPSEPSRRGCPRRPGAASGRRGWRARERPRHPPDFVAGWGTGRGVGGVPRLRQR